MAQVLLLLGLILVLAAFGTLAEIPVDANGRLSENLYIVRKSAPAEWTRMNPIGRTKIITDDVSLFKDDKAVAVCLWKGYPVDYIKDTVRVARAGDDIVNFIQKECDHLELGFISYFQDEVLTITWLDPRTGELTESVTELEAGERNTAWIHTVPSHSFRVQGRNFDQVFVATVPSIFTVGVKPDYTTLGRTITEQNKIGRIMSELGRVRIIKRVFTDVGFKKIQVPRDVWAEIQTYWYNNRNHRAREEWLDSGFFVNWHVRVIDIYVHRGFFTVPN